MSNNIITYEHRRNPRYLKVLKERLSVDGENGLLSRAIPLATPREFEGRLLTKVCTVAFLGISANILFDRSRAFIRDGGEILCEVMEDLFRRHREFPENSVWLKLRFLLIYPYSTYAMSFINAETTTRRCAMFGESLHPSIQQEFQVDDDRFKASSFFKSQKTTLNVVQEWIEKYHWQSREGNSIAVRFTPLAPNMCVLIVNDTVFFDSYTFAKQYRYDDRLVFSCPLLQIEKLKNEWTFRSLEDHFNYLWRLNITLDCFGATEFEPGVQDSLGLIKPPDKVSFEPKARQYVRRNYIPPSAIMLHEQRIKEGTDCLTVHDQSAMLERLKVLQDKYCISLPAREADITI